MTRAVPVKGQRRAAEVPAGAPRSDALACSAPSLHPERVTALRLLFEAGSWDAGKARDLAAAWGCPAAEVLRELPHVAAELAAARVPAEVLRAEALASYRRARNALEVIGDHAGVVRAQQALDRAAAPAKGAGDAPRVLLELVAALLPLCAREGVGGPLRAAHAALGAWPDLQAQLVASTARALG